MICPRVFLPVFALRCPLLSLIVLYCFVSGIAVVFIRTYSTITYPLLTYLNAYQVNTFIVSLIILHDDLDLSTAISGSLIGPDKSEGLDRPKICKPVHSPNWTIAPCSSLTHPTITNGISRVWKGAFQTSTCKPTLCIALPISLPSHTMSNCEKSSHDVSF